MPPLFSLLIAAYNSESTLAETLDSLLGQTDARWEAIVVDDGSSDHTAVVAERYAVADARIRVIRQANAGAAMARNAAAEVASGGWLCALDADDLLVPEAFERQAAFIEAHPGYDLYSWGSLKLLHDGSRVPFDESAEYRSVGSFGLADLIDHNRILSNTLIASSTFADVGGFHDTYVEDYDLWLRVLHAGGRHLHNPELLAVYRMREDSKSTDSVRAMAGTADVLESFSDTPGLAPDLGALAREHAAYWRSWAARTELDACLAAGEYDRARSLARPARATFPPGVRSRLGMLLLSMSPSAYARYKQRRAG